MATNPSNSFTAGSEGFVNPVPITINRPDIAALGSSLVAGSGISSFNPSAASSQFGSGASIISTFRSLSDGTSSIDSVLGGVGISSSSVENLTNRGESMAENVASNLGLNNMNALADNMLSRGPSIIESLGNGVGSTSPGPSTPSTTGVGGSNERTISGPSTVSSVENGTSQAFSSTPTSQAFSGPGPNAAENAMTGASTVTMNVGGKDIDLTAAQPKPDALKASQDKAKNEVGKERLFKVLPRSALPIMSGDSAGYKMGDLGDRGQICNIRLLANPKVSQRPTVTKNPIDKDLALLQSADGYDQFMLTGVSMAYSEKVQVSTTFGDNEVVYYFGKQPVMANLNGILFDSLGQNWFARFVTLYMSVLRGSRLAQNFELLEVTLPNMIITGTITGMSYQQEAINDTGISFSMQFLVKQLTPIPADMSNKQPTNSYTTLIDWNLGKGGFGGPAFLQSAKNAAGAVSSLASWSNFSLGGSTGIGSAFSKTVESFRQNTIQPIYGIVASITKVVKQVTGDITSIINQFTAPVTAVLRDIQNIAGQVEGLVKLVESSINSIIKIPEQMIQDIKGTLSSLQHAAGVISRAPETVSQMFQRLVQGGQSQSAVLGGGAARSVSAGASLGSGATPVSTGAIVGSGAPRLASKTPYLNSGARYNPLKANRL